MAEAPRYENPSGRIFYTVGHSTRTLEEFLALVGAYGVEVVADVRTLAGSRHVPQFNAEELERVLPEAGIGYVYLGALGGLRHTTRESPNAGWRNKSFRGYADYMQTAAFAEGLSALITLGGEKTAVIMCAEAVPWRCHRSLIGDALLVRGFRVMDIFSQSNARPHRLTSFAHVEGSVITYPAAP